MHEENLDHYLRSFWHWNVSPGPIAPEACGKGYECTYRYLMQRKEFKDIVLLQSLLSESNFFTQLAVLEQRLLGLSSMVSH